MVTTTTGLATSFITFTRTSNATVTDSNGFIEWAGHNLLTNSESFDASAWNKASASVSVTANAAAAPDGASTADKIIPSTGNVEHVIINNSAVTTVSGVQYTGAIYAKAAEYGFVFVSLDVTGSATACAVCVNLSDGTTSNTGGSGTYSVTSVGNGWWRISISATASTTAGYLAAYPRAAAGTTTAYVGTGTSGILLWGAHLYRSDLGGMVLNPARGDAYYPTTPPNRLGFTEDFSNAAWLTVEAAPASGSEIAPNGLPTGDRLSDNAISSRHIIYQQFSGDFAVPRTLSVYAKANTLRYLALSVTNTGDTQCYSAIFDLQTGGAPVTKTNGLATVTAQITPAGNGWYRCAISGIISTSSSGNFFPLIGTSDRADFSGSLAQNNMPLYVGTGRSLYLWGAQLSDSASLDAYSPVYGAAVTSAAYYAPRLDFDPVTLAAKGLLVEEQRANLMLRSNEFNISWVAAGTTVTANTTAVTAPDGTTTADKLVETATTGSHSITQQITSVIGRVYTASVYAKAAERTIIAVRIDNLANSFTWFNLATGVIGTKQSGVTATITDAGGGWYRCSVTGTATATNHGLEVYIADADNSSSYAGDITKGVYLYGAQLEDNAPFATSYIPTGASTATRTADVASVSTQAFPYSATEGTIVVAWQLAQLSGSPAAIHLTDDAENNRIRINAHLAGTNRSTITAAGSLVANIDTSTAAIGITKYGLAGKTTDYAVYRNGLTGGISTNTGFPAGCTELRIGRDGASGNFNGHIRQITYIPRRLSNSELQARTA